MTPATRALPNIKGLELTASSFRSCLAPAFGSSSGLAFGVCIYHNAREDDKILKTLLDWLNVNSGAVTAIATAVGAVVTAIYAFFTILLWRVTKEQAAITRHIFEASHRPYVTVRAQEPPETHVQGRLLFHMVFENQGTVPADITAWEVRGTLMDGWT